MSTTPRVRLDPAARREQLLTLGVKLLGTRSLDELSIEMLAEEAGISRGLLYHYFGNKHDFHAAVVQRAADDLIAATMPPSDPDPLVRLSYAMTGYLDYVVANYQGYLSLMKSAGGGNATLRAIYDNARNALTERLFAEDPEGLMLPDNPKTRMVVRAWSAMVEDLALSWASDPRGVTREEVLELLGGSLPALVALATPATE